MNEVNQPLQMIVGETKTEGGINQPSSHGLVKRDAVVSDGCEISIIVPVFNEVDIIGPLVQQIQEVMEGVGKSYEIVVVDDCSDDGSEQAARDVGARLLSHPYNIGNGGAIKTGIRNAKGKIIVMMDGDGQHNPEDIPRLLTHLERYDMVVGARTSTSDTGVHRDFGNWIYNWMATYVCNRKIEDLTSGFRAIRAPIAREFVYLLPNTFSYPTTLTLSLARSGYSFIYEPIQTRGRIGKSKIKIFRDGFRFLMIIFKVTTLFSPLKIFFPASVLMFLLGVGYGLFKIIFLNSRYGPTSALLMVFGMLIFLVGLVSEQVAQMRFDPHSK